MCYSCGNHNEALDILKDLVKEAPDSYQPWLTIGTIYSELGDIVKSQGALFMAAHLNERDDALWVRLAEQSAYTIFLFWFISFTF